MNNNYQSVVEDTFVETLEDIAFIFSEKIDAEEALDLLDASEFYLVSMQISGKLNGGIKIGAEKAIGNILAENMLGSQDEENEELYIDSLKEITNVICGKIVTEMAGTEPIVNLSIPEVNTINQKAFKALIQAENSLVFNSEEHLMTIIFEFENELEQAND